MSTETKRRLWPRILLGVVGLLVVTLAVGYLFRKQLYGKLLVWWVVPPISFEASKVPPAPDYAKKTSWSALPDVKDYADFVPKGVKVTKGPKKADVFFLHPTTYFSRKRWNAPLSAKSATRRVDVAVTKHQASSFNSCCRIFAPRYRQATLGFAFRFEPNGRKSIDLAYADVVRAFQHYMKHWNKGRPIIIAAHSQGSTHGLRLVEEFFASKPLGKRLVAAYLIGTPVHSDKFQRTLKPFKPCADPADTGCIISWMTLGKEAVPASRYSRVPKYYPPKGYEDVRKRKHICTNPLSWKTDGALAPASMHHGAIPYTKKKTPLPKPVQGILTAQCKGGALMISTPTAKGFNRFIFGKDDYHIYDYHLFYMNIRNNALQRVNAFVAKTK